MACPDRLGQEQDHLDPTDLGVAGRSVGDMGNGDESEEDLEDLEDLAGVAFSQNDLPTARADYAQSLAIRQRLAAADPTDAGPFADLRPFQQQQLMRAMAKLILSLSTLLQKATMPASL